MQDPHVDVAMFCIYSLYNKRQVDRMIAVYFTETCSDETRTKIYCYIAACGLLWSKWCEYKRNLGVEFGEYSLRQYRYTKDYYRIVQVELKKPGKVNAISRKSYYYGGGIGKSNAPSNADSTETAGQSE